jgi:hypothetical protein
VPVKGFPLVLGHVLHRTVENLVRRQENVLQWDLC